MAWAEQPQTIDEVGSTFTIQGFDLNYAGVILGPSVKYRDGKIVFDPSESCNDKAVRNRTLSDGTKQKFGEELLKHEVRVLMTRGVNGMYIYACDPELQNALLEANLQHVKEELADVMVYSQNLLDKLGLDADEIVNMKLSQNEAKYPVDKAKGSSAKYTEL